jgi:ribosomal protein S27AE
MMDRTTNDTTEIDCPQCGAPVAMPKYVDVAVCGFCGSTLARDRALGAVRDPGMGPVPPESAEARPAGALEEGVLHSVQCSQCAGPLSASEGRRILVCGHCGVRVAVKEHGGVSRWYFPARINRLKAAAAAAAWLGEYPGVAKEARDAQFVQTQLVYAPIWEYRALVAGWEFGHKARTRTEFVPDSDDGESGRLELRLAEEVVKEPRLHERRFYQAATDFGALGATRPRVTGRELLLPLLAGELDPSATVLEDEGVGNEVAERGRRAALQPLAGAVSPDSHLFAFRESTALLYYPLWVVHFRPRRGSCRVVVNGRDGSVNAAVAPADNRRRIALLAAQAAGMAIVVAVLVWLAVTWESGRVSMAAAAVIVSLIAILSVWRFRTVEGVEYHEPFSS